MTDVEDGSAESGLSEEEIAILLEKSTFPDNVKWLIEGNYDSQEKVNEIASPVYSFLQLFGAFLNLEGIEAVTIAADYKAAVAGVERGFGDAPALSPSEDVFGSGSAMAVPVLRGGTLKTHIVLHSGIAQGLVSTEKKLSGLAVHLIAHEAGHAHDHEIENRNLPGWYSNFPPDYRERRLFLLAHRCWAEYIASHLSSRWGTDSYCKEYSEMLCSMLSTARQRGNAALDGYQQDKDIGRVERGVIEAYGEFLVRVSYLVGHVHGLGKSVEESAPEFLKLVNEATWFTPIFERYEANVRVLQKSYGAWSGIEVFEPLKQTFELLLRAGGMTYYRLPFDEQWRIGLNRPAN